jgi:hypothetical protein
MVESGWTSSQCYMKRTSWTRSSGLGYQRPPTAQRDPKQELSSTTTSVRVNDHAPPPSQSMQFEIKHEPNTYCNWSVQR